MRWDTEPCELDEVVEANKHASSDAEVVAKVSNVGCRLSQTKRPITGRRRGTSRRRASGS